jgi:DNA-directed RNA polymerase subunit RPC12/RpoP
MPFGVIKMGKRKIEYLLYKCSKCGKSFPLNQVEEIFEKHENGSTLTRYICFECKKKEEEEKKE